MEFNIKNVCCIGAGYVGGPSMAMISYKNPLLKVNVVDLDEDRINHWNQEDLNKLPIFEPGLKEIIKKCRNKNLFFTNNVEDGISKADMIFICVNTPTKIKGLGAGQASDLKWIEASARQIAKFAKSNTIIIEKSTIPVKTAETIKAILTNTKTTNSEKIKSKNFYVLSNPEFLSEGSAIEDLSNPDRVLIGGENSKAIEALSNLYTKWIPSEKIIKTNLWSSELSKLTSNAFLAQRISSINSISALCEVTGANINEVSRAVGSDNRINSKFLKAGPGFGGSCFKKDILNLVYLCNFYGLNEVAKYWESILDLNIWQQKRITSIIVNNLFGTLTGKNIGILGFSFKANTNDTRESPAINICKDLIEEGANLKIYDPKVNHKQIEKDLGKKVYLEGTNNSGTWKFFDDLYKVSIDSDALVVLTEWDEFSKIDWSIISRSMRSPSWIFDTRNITNKEEIKKNGIKLWEIGVSNNPS